METITFILLIVFLTGIIFMFRLINNLYDKVDDQAKLIVEAYNKINTICQGYKRLDNYMLDAQTDARAIVDAHQKINESIRNNTGIVNMIHDDIDSLDERIEQHWHDYEKDYDKIRTLIIDKDKDSADWHIVFRKELISKIDEMQAEISLIKDMVNSCKYKMKKSNKQLGNTEKQSVQSKIDTNFNYTKTDN